MPTKSAESLPVQSSEAVRKELPGIIREVASTKSALPFGSNPDRPRYQICPLSHLTTDELATAVHVTADQARKAWADLRAAVRLFDLKFVLAVDGTECAVVQRHPSYTRTRFQRLINQCRRIGSADERLANLERVVEDLQRRVGNGDRKNG